MAHEPRVSPISKLHDDILWSIFQLNSHLIIDYSRLASVEILVTLYHLGRKPTLSLVTNRRTSQVCRRWRELIVNSPAIWANTIDLQHLNQQGDEWRNEVLKRTGNAPLTIAGEVGNEGSSTGYNLCMIPFVVELLTTHWNRVRTLILYSHNMIVDEALCFVSRCPAPSLENLVIAFNHPHGSENVVPFENYAPCLHTLSTRRFAFNFSEPSWSSNLCHLNLAWSKRDMSITELLLGLENMISLETLHLWDITPESNMDLVPPNDRIPTIKFSSLRNLTIEDCPSSVPDLICHIVVRSQCSLDITNDFDDFDAEAPKHIAFCCTTFLQNNFPPRDVIDLSYSLEYIPGPDGLTNDAAEESDYLLTISLNRSTKGRKEGLSFQYIANMIGLSDIPFRMARALSSYDLSNITTFMLILNLCKDDDVLEHPLFENMYDFLLTLKSVDTLHTDNETLQFYMGSEVLNVNNVLFPCLVTVFTDNWDIGIHQFLEYRHENSNEPVEEGTKPINRLVFEDTSTTPIGFPPALNVASKLGVTVGWKGKLKKVSIADDGVLEFAP